MKLFKLFSKKDSKPPIIREAINPAITKALYLFSCAEQKYVNFSCPDCGKESKQKHYGSESLDDAVFVKCNHCGASLKISKLLK